MSLSSLLNSVCTIEKPVYTKDAAGGPVPSYTTLASLVACTIQATSGSASFKFGQRQIFITHRIYFDRDVGIKRGYRVKDAIGQYYVVYAYGELAGRSFLWRADVTLQLDS